MHVCANAHVQWNEPPLLCKIMILQPIRSAIAVKSLLSVTGFPA